MLENVLTPRTKGWVMTMAELRHSVDAVYTFTLAMDEQTGGHGGIGETLAGKPTGYHAHIKRTPIAELPDTDQGLEQWCSDAYVYMDGKLGEYKRTGERFSDASAKRVVQHQRRTFPVLLVLGWNALAAAACVTIDGAGFVLAVVVAAFLLPMVAFALSQDTAKKAKKNV